MQPTIGRSMGGSLLRQLLPLCLEVGRSLRPRFYAFAEDFCPMWVSLSLQQYNAAMVPLFGQIAAHTHTHISRVWLAQRYWGTVEYKSE